MRRVWASSLLVAVIGILATPSAASAHPLGNFTTNQYAGLRVTADGVDADYVLDLAELPAYQAAHEEIDADGDGILSSAEKDAYSARTCQAVAASTALTVDGRAVALAATPVALTFPPGAGGLTTQRLQCILHGSGRPTSGTSIDFRLGYLESRIGWREITAVGDRFTLTRTSVPAVSSSARLTAYPKNAPTLDVRSAALTVRPGGPAAAPFAGEQAFLEPQARGVDRFTAWFTDLVGHPSLTWGVGLLAVLAALVLGGAHAVAPGHGKTIMAAYLVGARGRLSHALTVAATVAVTHTAGVLVLGVLLATSLQLAPVDLYAWLRLASGLLVALVGAQLLRRAMIGARARKAAAHNHSPLSAHAEPRALVHTGQVTVPAHDHPHGAAIGGGPVEHAHIGMAPAHDGVAVGHVYGEFAGDLEHGHAHSGVAGDHARGGMAVGPSHDHVHAGVAVDHEHSHAHDHGSVSVDHEHGHAHDHASDGDGVGVGVGVGHTHDHPHGGVAIDHSHDHAHADSAVGPAHDHPHAEAGGAHSHGGGRPHVHYVPAADEPFRMRTLLAMGFAGGLSPSPSAVVVLLGAAALGRAWYGVVLVLAYGIGLAAVLTGIGLALARWGERLRAVGSGRFARLLTHRMPTVTAAAILAVGLGMAAVAVTGLLTTNS
jgi:nickel/cobalt exporter